MQLIVNGELKNIPTATNIAELVQALEINIQQVAIECNAAIVPRSRYAETILNEGDRIEILRFIGGG